MWLFMLEGDLTDQASCPRSSGSDPQTVISDTVVLSAGTVRVKAPARVSPDSPMSRHNPFNEDSDTNTTNTSADVTPVHLASHHITTTTTNGDGIESGSNELEVIRYNSDSCSRFHAVHNVFIILFPMKKANDNVISGWLEEGNQPRSDVAKAPLIPAAAFITPSLLITWTWTAAFWPLRMWIH